MRVITFNIRHGLGLDGKSSLKSIALCLQQLRPDLVTLNEVDKHLPRSRFVHQAQKLAKALQYYYCYDPTISFRIGAYGNAIISKWPLELVVSLPLPAVGEPRKLSVVRIDAPRGEMFLGCTHLGLDLETRALQLKSINETLKEFSAPIILAGDFNEEVDETWFASIGLRQAVDEHGNKICTFPSLKARAAIDHIFYSHHFCRERAFTLAKSFSDHQPLITDLSTK